MHVHCANANSKLSLFRGVGWRQHGLGNAKLSSLGRVLPVSGDAQIAAQQRRAPARKQAVAGAPQRERSSRHCASCAHRKKEEEKT